SGSRTPPRSRAEPGAGLLGARKKDPSQESRHSNGLSLAFNKTSNLESVGGAERSRRLVISAQARRPAFGPSRTGTKGTARLVHDALFGSKQLNDFVEARIAAERVPKREQLGGFHHH